MKTRLIKTALLALAAAGMILSTGCASSEPENRSPRAWNSPTGWDSGLPASMFEGR